MIALLCDLCDTGRSPGWTSLDLVLGAASIVAITGTIWLLAWQAGGKGRR